MADAGEPDDAAEIMVGVVVAADLLHLLILLPSRVEFFRGLVHQHVGANRFDAARKLGHFVHRQLRLLDGEHRPLGLLLSVQAITPIKNGNLGALRSILSHVCPRWL